MQQELELIEPPFTLDCIDDMKMYEREIKNMSARHFTNYGVRWSVYECQEVGNTFVFHSFRREAHAPKGIGRECLQYLCLYCDFNLLNLRLWCDHDVNDPSKNKVHQMYRDLGFRAIQHPSQSTVWYERKPIM